MRTGSPPLLPLFRSDAQARLLAELFLRTPAGQPQRELARRADVAESNAARELRRLVDAGVVTAVRVGRQRLVSANTDSIYYQPLRELLELAFGALPVLARALQAVEGIEAAALFGSYAARLAGEPGPAPQDVDLLIVGTVNMSAVYEACREAEQQLRREVNPTVLTPDEWRTGDSGFLRQLRGRPIRPVIGTLP